MPSRITTYENAWNAKPDGRTSEEIYDSIVRQMQADHSLSNKEAHDAARKLIGYCREIMTICAIKVD